MRPTVALVTLLLLAGCLTGVSGGTVWETDGTDRESTAQVTESPTTSAERLDGPDDGDLLSRSQLRTELAERGENPDEYDLRLFYVDADGTWYCADPDGTVGAVAPDGDVVPGVFVDDPPGTPAPERIDLAAADRPTYVWKVTKTTGTPTTAVVDAESGETLGVWTVPGRGRAPPTTA